MRQNVYKVRRTGGSTLPPGSVPHRAILSTLGISTRELRDRLFEFRGCSRFASPEASKRCD